MLNHQFLIRRYNGTEPVKQSPVHLRLMPVVVGQDLT
jgi:hypothetical protein